MNIFRLLARIGLLLACAPTLRLSAQALQLDPLFAPSVVTETDALPAATFSATSDAQFVICGTISHVNGTAAPNPRLLRLNADGSHDTSFQANLGSIEATEAAPLGDGRVLVVKRANAAIPATFDAVWQVVRLLANGSPDASFTAPTFSSPPHLAVRHDGSIIAWGGSASVSGVGNGLVRLLADGTVDPAFNPSFATSLYVNALQLDAQDRLVLSGYGRLSGSTLSQYFLVRLTAAGEFDATFSPGAVGSTFALLATLSDGRVLAGNGNLTRYLSDGSRDSTFAVRIPDLKNLSRVAVLPGDRLVVDADTGATNTIRSVFVLNADGSVALDCRQIVGAEPIQYFATVLPDGRFALVQGLLTWELVAGMEYSIVYEAGMSRPHLCLVDPVAATLTSLPTTLAYRQSGRVNRLSLDSSGRVLVEGAFTHVNDAPRAGYARFDLDGTLDAAFQPPDGTATHLFTYPDHRVVALQTYLSAPDASGFRSHQSRLVRLLADGSLDPAFTPPTDLDLSDASQWLLATDDGRTLVAAFEPDNSSEANLKLLWLATDGHRLTTLPTRFADFTSFVALSESGIPAVLLSLGNTRHNIVERAVLLANGQLLVAIAANTVNGSSHPYLVRLNGDGSVDETYRPNLGSLVAPACAEPLSDGRALIRSTSSLASDSSLDVVVRLNADGSLDPTFDASTLLCGIRLADGTYFLAGRRYFADGSLDTSFAPQFEYRYNTTTAALTADGSLWVGGYPGLIDGLHRDGLARFVPVARDGFALTPATQALVAGRDAVLRDPFDGSSVTSFQWTLNGSPIAGATSATLRLAAITAADAGEYRLVVVIAGKTYTSAAAVLTVTANTTRLVNFSARSHVVASGPPQIGGFVLRGADPHPLLLRAVGRGLGWALPLNTLLPQPALKLHEASAVIAHDAGGALAPAIVTLGQRLGAFALSSSTSDAIHDSALALALPSGAYSAHVTSADTQSGLSLFEFYDAAESITAPAVANVSLRAQVGSGDDTLIGGFVVSGNGPLPLLIRAIGPQLARLGVNGVLADPRLTLRRGSTVLAENDNWSDSPDAAPILVATQQTGAFALPVGSMDSALLVTLDPGIYTAQVSGIGATSGEAMLELYVVDPN